MIGEWNISPTVDAVDEFKVMTITFDAQYGRIVGGAVNTIINSGSRNFHGTLYDFWRNSALDANTYQNNLAGVPRAFHNQHPVRRDSWRSNRSRQAILLLLQLGRLARSCAESLSDREALLNAEK